MSEAFCFCLAGSRCWYFMVMDQKTVWDILASIPIGTLIAWIAVVIAIISIIVGATIKLYKLFEKYHRITAENEQQKKLMTEHGEAIKKINTSLDEIKKSLDEQRDVNLKQIRHEIVRTCDEALRSGSITASAFRSLEELYDEYKNVFGGNGYVKSLVTKVRQLPITGSIEE